ncbi:MAG: bifunctional (p)ppGpp synthetase/guanosine-3',5'-bis(diphosphate) 3'-pyrophosphohydrolase, partial [Anaerolineales bacterium]|nr:bifunctional (p)ppGpp synthetase/guanosine-3',5'-bis(diphosphate) 3'-pyrophosphohydrolase [Anaerolineales bacterium]
MDIQGLLDSLPELTSPADREIVQRAFKVAKKVHRKQKRASGEPYVNHCLAVAGILADLGAPIPVIVSGLLHDTVEDTSITLDDIKRDFGEEIRMLVDGVTKLTQLPRVSHSGKRAQDPLALKGDLAKETLRKTFLAMGDDVRVVVIKLADRLHNMRTLSHLPLEKQTRIAKETLEIFAPLASRLGIWQMKWDLEDLAFRYTFPGQYKEIAALVSQRREDREEKLGKVTAELKRYLAEYEIEAEVTGRPKHLYSIYRKMERKGVPIDMVYDVRAVRVVVESESSCYLALGVIHNHWKPVPG